MPEEALTAEQIDRMNSERARLRTRLSDEEFAEMNRKRHEAVAAMTPAEVEAMRQRRARLMPGADG